MTSQWQQRLGELADKHRVPGASLGILRVDADGRDELVEAAHGVLSLATGVDVTPDSGFQIGSITKVWTATLVMQLVDEGRLDLDAPVTDVLPGLRLGSEELTGSVTMRHLLTHTSGIDGDVFADTGRGDDCVERYVAGLADVAVNHPLGVTLSYCNSGFVLAGRVIEVLEDATWDEVLRRRLIDPLGLTHTSTLPEEAVLGRAAVGHLGEAGVDLRPTPVWGLPRAVGPAGLITAAARDVLGFVHMHLRGGTAPDGTSVLSPDAVAAMREWQVDVPAKNGFGDSWGIGWHRGDWSGHQMVGHNGGTIGQSAFLRVLPELGTAVVLLTNGGETAGLYEDLMPEVIRELTGVEVPEPIRPPETPATIDRARHLGTYERTGSRLDVIERDGELVLQSTDTIEIVDGLGEPTVEEFPLTPLDDDVLVYWQPKQGVWAAVTRYELADGTPYLHAGTRANRKIA